MSDLDNDYLGLWQIPSLLSRAGVATVAGRRALGIRLVRDLIETHGLVPGFLAEGGGFDPWPLEPDSALARIEREWAAMPGDPNVSDICWFDKPTSRPR